MSASSTFYVLAHFGKHFAHLIMSEILDIVVDASQLVDLVYNIVKNFISYYNSVREAPRESMSMRREACSLLAILEDLEIVLKKYKEQSREPPNIRSIEKEFKEARGLLEDIQKYTRPESIQGRLRLIWRYGLRDEIWHGRK
jgi:hypothetical protein